MTDDIAYIIWRDKHCFPDDGTLETPSGLLVGYKFINSSSDELSCVVDGKSYSRGINSDLGFEYGRALAKEELIKYVAFLI